MGVGTSVFRCPSVGVRGTVWEGQTGTLVDVHPAVRLDLKSGTGSAWGVGTSVYRVTPGFPDKRRTSPARIISNPYDNSILEG